MSSPRPTVPGSVNNASKAQHPAVSSKTFKISSRSMDDSDEICGIPSNDATDSSSLLKRSAKEIPKHKVGTPGVYFESQEGQEFKHKVDTYLPSRSLYRKKRSFICPVSGAHTIAVVSNTDESSTFDNLIKSLSLSKSKPRDSVDFAEIAVEDFKIGDDIEEDTYHWDQLASVRSLPVPMNEKRRIRDELLQHIPETKSGKTVWNIQQHKVKARLKVFWKELQSMLQLWSSTLKAIEGRFGTGVVSYFVFLRWLLYLNLIMFFTTLIFIVLPQALFPKELLTENKTRIEQQHFASNVHHFSSVPTDAARYAFLSSEHLYHQSVADFHDLNIDFKLDTNLTNFIIKHFNPSTFPDISTVFHSRENYTTEERYNLSRYCLHRYLNHLTNTTRTDVAGNIQDLFQGSGWMEYTLMFCGYYYPGDVLIGGGLHYNIPVAFLVVFLVVVFLCIAMMVHYASKGVRETLLVRGVQQKYCNVLFSSWDFCIEHARTANIKHSSIFLELKSNLAEERRKAEIDKWTMQHRIQIYIIRFIVNIVVVMALVGAYYLIFFATEKQIEAERNAKAQGFTAMILQFLPSIIITALNFIMPLIVNILVKFEKYNTQTAINITLVRIVFIRLASIIILVSSFYRQITCEPKDMCDFGLKSCISPICWETYVGQQMYKLAIMDFFVVVGVTFFWEVPRKFAVTRWKNKLTKILGFQTFDIPTQVLSLVYSQTLCWLGMFYSPLLPAVSVIKTVIFFYLKQFTVLKNCVPEQIPYKASRSNSIFMVVLMLSFFIVVAIMGYSINKYTPSPGCSPFRYYNHMVHAANDAIQRWSPQVNIILTYIFSSVFAIPAIILLCLAIYYYLTVAAAHRRMIKMLKVQLVFEGRDKQFLLARLTEVARKEKKKK